MVLYPVSPQGVHTIAVIVGDHPCLLVGGGTLVRFDSNSHAHLLRSLLKTVRCEYVIESQGQGKPGIGTENQ